MSSSFVPIRDQIKREQWTKWPAGSVYDPKWVLGYWKVLESDLLDFVFMFLLWFDDLPLVTLLFI